MKYEKLALLALLGAGCSLGCDGQQYVSPDTVALVVTDDATQVQRVNRCQYIPVLRGSQVTFRYEVDDELKAILSITRDAARVSFEPRGTAPVFEVDADQLGGSETHADQDPPAGYTVELIAGCEPDDEYD